MVLRGDQGELSLTHVSLDERYGCCYSVTLGRAECAVVPAVIMMKVPEEGRAASRISPRLGLGAPSFLAGHPLESEDIQSAKFDL